MSSRATSQAPSAAGSKAAERERPLHEYARILPDLLLEV